MKELAIMLGGRQFMVPQRTIRADAEWRRIVQPLVEPLAEMAMAAGVSAPTPDRLVKLAFGSALLIEPDAVLDAVLEYSPTLSDEAEWIGDHAYSDEALTALLTLFFGMTPAPKAAALTNGVAAQLPATTSTN